MKARARRIEFHLSMVFPPNEDYSVPLLRLMLATDDSRHLRKLLLNADEHFDKGNDLECSILNGELLHLFRLLCGHLYEAGVAFRSLERIRPGYFKNILPNREEIITHLLYLNTAYSVGEEGAFHYSFLKPVRDRVGFHYKETIFLERLTKHVQTEDLEGNLIITQFSGLSRYSVTDHLVMSAIHDLFGGGLDNFQENFEQAMGQAINLAASLENILDNVLLSIFKSHPEFISKIIEGEVCISPSFLKAKEKADRLRDNTSIK